MVILSSPIEHPSVLGALRALEAQGHRIEWAELDGHGAVHASIADVVRSLRPGFLVCMAANNETGAVQPWREWAEAGAAVDCPIHVDATQAWGKWSDGYVYLPSLGNCVVSGHKRGALSGVGAMHSSGVPLEGWLGEGPQERGRRGGTENLLGIHSLGCVAPLKTPIDPALAPLLEREIASIEGVRLTLPAEKRVPGHVHLRLPVRADLVLQRLDLAGFSVSTGSACASGSLRPSRVLLAMGWTEDEARHALRLSMGWTNGHDDVTSLAQSLKEILADLGE